MTLASRRSRARTDRISSGVVATIATRAVAAVAAAVCCGMYSFESRVVRPSMLWFVLHAETVSCASRMIAFIRAGVPGTCKKYSAAPAYDVAAVAPFLRASSTSSQSTPAPEGDTAILPKVREATLSVRLSTTLLPIRCPPAAEEPVQVKLVLGSLGPQDEGWKARLERADIAKPYLRQRRDPSHASSETSSTHPAQGAPALPTSIASAAICKTPAATTVPSVGLAPTAGSAGSRGEIIIK
eukprot:7195248-Prymnesium_polylepis.2